MGSNPASPKLQSFKRAFVLKKLRLVRLLATTASLALGLAATPAYGSVMVGKTYGPCNHPPLVKSLAAMRFPKNAYQGGTKRSYAIVSISINERGRPKSVRIVESMGNAILDAAARDVVRNSIFVPAASGCGTVPGTLALTLRGGSGVVADPCDHPVLRVLQMIPAFPMIQRPRATVDVPVAVTVDEIGTVAGTRIVRSSAWKQVDELERGMAADSAYLPAVRNCTPIAATRVFTFIF